MKRVFVTYSRNNLDVVTQLIQDLQAVGVQAWYDQTLTGGQRWWDNILSNIRDCDIFIFALSPESWESEACRSELGYVAQLSKTILPHVQPQYVATPPASQAPHPEYSGSQSSGSTKSRRYACRRGDTPQLITDLKRWLDAEGFDSQQMQTEDQRVLLQVRRRGNWRNFVGMATSLNIVFNAAEDTLTVEIGSGKWIDKAAVGTVSMFILWPLAVTAGLGAWEQMKMPDKIFGFIESRFIYT